MPSVMVQKIRLEIFLNPDLLHRSFLGAPVSKDVSISCDYWMAITTFSENQVFCSANLMFMIKDGAPHRGGFLYKDAEGFQIFVDYLPFRRYAPDT